MIWNLIGENKNIN